MDSSPVTNKIDGIVKSVSSYTEERIFLNLPKKIKINFTYKEFTEWKPEPRTLYSIKVTGTWKECSGLRHSEKAQKMRIDGNKIEFITTTILEKDEIINEIPGVRNLKDVIASSIEKKKHLHSMYQRVFDK